MAIGGLSQMNFARENILVWLFIKIGEKLTETSVVEN